MPPLLFTPLKLRGLDIRNRIFVSPMCQYSCRDGLANDWHLVHLGARAVGGAGLVMAEATAVTPEGRISPEDLGLWSDTHAEALKPIAGFIRAQGATPAIQLAHAGRKASCASPWKGGKALAPGEGAWTTLAPSTLPFGHFPPPRALEREELPALVEAFRAAARRALEAGFEVVEIHMAHGYLLHNFLSPLSNARSDEYGGALQNRARLPLEVVHAVRSVWPERLPLMVRISATDWKDGGWDLEQSVQLARWLKEAGVDMIDCSSGGLAADAQIPARPGYQVPFAAAIRRDAGIATAAVGLITEAVQAEQILANGEADAVAIARASLRDPHWPLRAAALLHADIPWPVQYERSKPMF